ncbi:MAG: cbb3-type cytochrome c oxidase subunit 3 [Thioploca sp.]|nr:cbb3-type cytochrome c oxidase subunit 3 [Thioploca sp.]
MEILPLIHSIWTIVVMVVFLSIVVWAYSSKRQVKFDEAARLPLDDDDSVETLAKEKHHV